MNTQTTAANLEANLEAAKTTATSLRATTKQTVFEAWERECLGRVHNATIADQRKSWMIYDLIKARFGRALADRVA